MGAHPNGCVQRRRQSVAGVDLCDEAFLEGKRRGQPQLGQQYVARGEAVVERTAGGPQTFGDGADRDRRRPAFRGKIACRSEEVRMTERDSRHSYRVYPLEIYL